MIHRLQLNGLVRPFNDAANGRIGRYFGSFAIFWIVVSISGCSRWLPEMTPFGAVSSPDHNRSLNGLGVFRKMWESTGAKCLTPKKLSPRLESMDVIVLVGQSFSPPGRAARDWLEQWLSRDSGRTVVYFGRDFNADVYYRTRTLDVLPVDEKKQGQRFLAKRKASDFSSQVRQISESTFCRWFYMDIDTNRRSFKRFTGPWASGLDELEGEWPVGVTLLPPRSGNWNKRKPSWLTAPPATNPLAPASSFADREDTDATIVRSTWEVDELDTDEKWAAELEAAASAEVLLASDDDTPLVYSLSDSEFAGSKILIVANGAPMLNGSLVDPLHQRIGEQIVEYCGPANRVALVAYDQLGFLITNTAEQDASAVGLELFTVWPMSAITMTATFLGIVICAYLMPILGRAQPLRRPSVTDFGMHVESLGQMMMQTQDVNYAKTTIEEYFRKVRNESPPTWLDAIGDVSPQLTAPVTPTPPAQDNTSAVQSPVVKSPEDTTAPQASGSEGTDPPRTMDNPRPGD